MQGNNLQFKELSPTGLLRGGIQVESNPIVANEYAISVYLLTNKFELELELELN